MFDEDDKMHVHFSIELFGKTQRFTGVYDADIQWTEVLNDVVRTLEASYGYSFNLENSHGIYHDAKN